MKLEQYKSILAEMIEEAHHRAEISADETMLIEALGYCGESRRENAYERVEDVLAWVLKLAEQIKLPMEERKQGRWIEDGRRITHGYLWMHCSACGAQEIDVPASRTPYCPNCGAKMEGAEENE